MPGIINLHPELRIDIRDPEPNEQGVRMQDAVIEDNHRELFDYMGLILEENGPADSDYNPTRCDICGREITICGGCAL